MMNQPTDPSTDNQASTISRGDFVRSLGLNTAALMAFYCMGTSLTSCKKDDSTTPSAPTTTSGVTGTTTGSGINFTIDLTNSSNSSLKTAGSALKVGDVFIANAKSGYIAVQRLCTHQAQDALSYRLANDNILCSAHGSIFSTTGAVVQGPAATALTRYTTSLSADGNTLTVKA